MNACRCTHSILIRAAKTPKKTAIKLCHKQNQLFKQIKPPAVLQETLGSCWGGHSMQGAQHTALTPAHSGHRAGTTPLSRKVDIFWKHPCYFTCFAVCCTCAVTLELFRKGWEGGAAGSLPCSAQGGCSRPRSSSKRETDHTHRYPGSPKLFFKIHFDFKRIAEKEDVPERQD